ncbi:TPA_asm: 50S ribosomal protein L22 [Campylobacter jejuni]|nr:50S ribosomal protein L22 [Campylobacter jejuni]
MSKALIKFIRLSSTKARLIAREVQGMNAELAMASLKFMPNKGAKYIANAISSAVANGGFEANEVIVKSCRVDAAAVLKRFRPRARGSASRIRKPTSHILVEVVKAEVKAEEKKTVAKKTTTTKAPAKKTTSTKKATAKKTTSTKKATAKKES